MGRWTPLLCVAGLVAVLGVRLVAEEPAFPDPKNTEPESEAKRLTPGQAAAAFEMPEGFRVSVFAGEPDVQNPLAMAWDPRGRLWIAENYTYADRTVKFDLSLRDRVLVFEDQDGDGRFDSRKVFTDDVQLLSSVEVGLGGVWLMAPPRLLFVPDRDGDDVPDGSAEVVLDGFEPTTDNYHTFANGLRWGPDGWLYGRCGASSPGRIGIPGTPPEKRVPLYGGIWRYHPVRRTFEVLSHGTTNPWGLDWNAHGEAFFVNTVNGHLWHVIPGAHFQRPHSVDPNPTTYVTIDTHADHYHWDTGKAWSDSKIGSPETDRLGGGHAHCGAMIYLGDNWPDAYRGKLMTLNLHGRRINVDRLEREGSGYVGQHDPDILRSADPWFRGLELGYGPDGAVYILDWSDTGECHEHTGVHRTSGRIFKVSYGEPKQPADGDLRKLNAEQLVERHRSTNEWTVRQARRVLIDRFVAAQGGPPRNGVAGVDQREPPAERAPGAERSSSDADAPGLAAARVQLRREFNQESDTQSRLRMLWTLAALDGTPREFLIRLLDDKDEHLRAWGVRLLTDAWPLDTIFGVPHPFAVKPDDDVFRALVNRALVDESALVRLALASTLQRVPVERRLELAAPLVARAADADDHNLPLMIWYGLMPACAAQPVETAKLASTCRLPITRGLIARRLGELIDKHPAAVEELLQHAGDDAALADVLRGLSDGFAGRRKVAAPAAWAAIQQRTSRSDDAALKERVRDLSVLFGDGRALDEVKQLALDNKAEVTVRQAALETYIEAAPADLRTVCEQLLGVRILNTTAVRGLARFDDPALGERLAKSYRSFWPPERPAVIEALVSRPTFARALLTQMKEGRIPTADLSAFQARQIRSFDKPELTQLLSAVWGELRDSPADKREFLAKLKSQLSPETLAAADRSHGRAVFNKVCANCHRLHGHGAQIGPDLTGAGRHNLDYVLENLTDPSAVVGAGYRVSVVVLNDGRVLTGTVTKAEQSLTVQTAKERIVVGTSDVDEIRPSPLSLMPDGLLQPLSATEIRDLVAYVMHPTQSPLPK